MTEKKLKEQADFEADIYSFRDYLEQNKSANPLDVISSGDIKLFCIDQVDDTDMFFDELSIDEEEFANIRLLDRYDSETLDFCAHLLLSCSYRGYIQLSEKRYEGLIQVPGNLYGHSVSLTSEEIYNLLNEPVEFNPSQHFVVV